MITQTKNLKPISVDAQFKYRCINPDCGSEHWLFLNQVKVKGFKLACDCGAVYKIRQIEKIRIRYVKKPQKPQESQSYCSTQLNSASAPKAQPEYIKKAYKILENYGFSNKEAIELVNKAYDLTKCDNPLLLVKDAIKIFGGI